MMHDEADEMLSKWFSDRAYKQIWKNRNAQYSISDITASEIMISVRTGSRLANRSHLLIRVNDPESFSSEDDDDEFFICIPR